MEHLISAKQFNKSGLDKFLATVDHVSQYKALRSGEGKIMATLFYQPSTRTRSSFEAAMIRVGGRIVSTENAAEFSSHSKGETLEDTIRVMGEYVDVIVLRHPDIGASGKAAKVSKVPVINAGDGFEHPTQALLDIYTIKKEIGRLDGIHVALVGDLCYGRTVHSLIHLLGLYNDVTITLVSPSHLQLPEGLFKEAHVSFEKVDSVYCLQDALQRQPDVVYMTRSQKGESYDKKFIFSIDELNSLKRDAVVMHPLPRCEEIDHQVDKDPRMAYFRQVGNGLQVRKTILYCMFSKDYLWSNT